jgi:hypothetical protein
VGAHAAQRLGDAVDGPAADRRVAVEDPRAPSCPASQPEQAHERPGVADVDRVGHLARLAQADAATGQLGVALLDQRAERAQRVERRVRVGRVEVVVDRTGSSDIAPSSAARWEIDLSAGR